MTQWLITEATDWYPPETEEIVPPCGKCFRYLNHGGEYVEKLIGLQYNRIRIVLAWVEYKEPKVVRVKQKSLNISFEIRKAVAREFFWTTCIAGAFLAILFIYPVNIQSRFFLKINWIGFIWFRKKTGGALLWTHSFSSLSYDRSTASSKAIYPHIAT